MEGNVVAVGDEHRLAGACGAWWYAVYDYYFGVDIADEEKVLRFQPPPYAEKTLILSGLKYQKCRWRCYSPWHPDMPTDISAMADVSAVGIDLLQSMPARRFGQFSEELSLTTLRWCS